MKTEILLVSLAVLAGCATVSPPVFQDTSSGQTESAEGNGATSHRSPFTEPPGAFLAAVTQDSVKTTICVPGWTAMAPPSTSFTQGLKKLMLTRAGVDLKEVVKYELDHFIPLAVGGHPRSQDNLWLQRWDGAWNARTKDRLERKLQATACAGQITL